MVYDVTGDAQAKLHALSQALLDELAKLQVRRSSRLAPFRRNSTDELSLPLRRRRAEGRIDPPRRR